MANVLSIKWAFETATDVGCNSEVVQICENLPLVNLKIALISYFMFLTAYILKYLQSKFALFIIFT